MSGVHVAHLARCHDEGENAARTIGYEVDLGPATAPGAADGLELAPPFPPAAARCALAVVLSINCNPPGVAWTSAASIRVQMPRCDQR
jgi:hypothetical protein